MMTRGNFAMNIRGRCVTEVGQLERCESFQRHSGSLHIRIASISSSAVRQWNLYLGMLSMM
jgi:hypothetical protein